MEAFEQYDLISRKKWTTLLESLEAGQTHTFSIPSVKDIHSLKSTAYNINTDKGRRVFSIEANKETRIVKISVGGI